jgi:uncharacterized protein YdaU (DUF1376 family)
MSEHPWMPLYVNDFRMDTLDLAAEEVGTYLTMLMIAWRRDDAGLPNDMAWLKRALRSCFADFHGHTFNRIVPKLLERYFLLSDDGIWLNKRLTKERQKADKLSANASQNANKRWAKTKENNYLSNAEAMPSQSQSQSQSYKEREVVVRLRGVDGRAGDCFVEVDTPEWKAWSQLKHWPQNDFRVGGRIKRGWWFRTEWPSSGFKPRANGPAALRSEIAG